MKHEKILIPVVPPFHHDQLLLQFQGDPNGKESTDRSSEYLELKGSIRVRGCLHHPQIIKNKLNRQKGLMADK